MATTEITVPFEVIDPNSLWLCESLATGEIDGYKLNFDRAGSVFIITLGKDGENIKGKLSMNLLIETLAKQLIETE